MRLWKARRGIVFVRVRAGLLEPSQQCFLLDGFLRSHNLRGPMVVFEHFISDKLWQLMGLAIHHHRSFVWERGQPVNSLLGFVLSFG